MPDTRDHDAPKRLSTMGEIRTQVLRRIGDTSDVLPEEVIAVLRQGGMEKPAAVLFKGIPEGRRTPEALDRITKARIQGAEKTAARVQDPGEILPLIRAHAMGALPGDKDVFAIIGGNIRDGIGALVQAEPKPDTRFLVVTLTGFYKKTIGEPLDVSAMDPKYGPLLQQDGFKDDKIQGSFMLLFPDSKYTKDLERQEAREAEQAKTEAVAHEHASEIDELWQEAEGRGDEIAVLAYKIRFGNQNFVKSRHNVRGLESMQLYRQGLVRDAFCPAKKAFIKATSAGEFQRRAAAHCKDEPPVEAGVGGTEVRLTSDCQAAFGTGC